MRTMYDDFIKFAEQAKHLHQLADKVVKSGDPNPVKTPEYQEMMDVHEKMGRKLRKAISEHLKSN